MLVVDLEREPVPGLTLVRGVLVVEEPVVELVDVGVVSVEPGVALLAPLPPEVVGGPVGGWDGDDGGVVDRVGTANGLRGWPAWMAPTARISTNAPAPAARAAVPAAAGRAAAARRSRRSSVRLRRSSIGVRRARPLSHDMYGEVK